MFNETFASLDGGKDLCILWRKGIAGRAAQDVASAFLKCIKVTSNSKCLVVHKFFYYTYLLLFCPVEQAYLIILVFTTLF